MGPSIKWSSESNALYKIVQLKENEINTNLRRSWMCFYVVSKQAHPTKHSIIRNSDLPVIQVCSSNSLCRELSTPGILNVGSLVLSDCHFYLPPYLYTFVHVRTSNSNGRSDLCHLPVLRHIRWSCRVLS